MNSILNSVTTISNISSSSSNSILNSDNDDYIKLSDFDQLNNLSSIVDVIRNNIKRERIIPDLYVWCFVGIVCIGGILLNGIIIIGLLRTKCTGLLYIILQITFCDIGLLVVAPIEMLYMTNRYWIFPIEVCSFYMGFESFTTTAVFYFIIAANFHSISTYNLALKEIYRLEENSRKSMLSESNDNDEDANQNDDIVTDQPNVEDGDFNKRSITIDYSKRKYSVSVILPVLFIWFLAASVSFPLFMFSNVIPNEQHPKFCGVLNFNKENNLIMRYLIFFIKICIPTILLLFTLINLFVKLIKSKRTLIELTSGKLVLDENVGRILKLSFFLSITFIVFALQKFYLSLLFEIIKKPFTSHKYPTIKPLYAIGLVAVFYTLSFIRPILYYVFDVKLKSKIKQTFLCSSAAVKV